MSPTEPLLMKSNLGKRGKETSTKKEGTKPWQIQSTKYRTYILRSYPTHPIAAPSTIHIASTSMSFLVGDAILVLDGGGVEAGHGEGGGEGLNLGAEGANAGVGGHSIGEVLDGLLLGGEAILDGDGDGEGAVNEGSDGLHVTVLHATGGEGAGAEADAAGAEGGLVAGDGVLVGADADGVEELLNLGAGEAKVLNVEEAEVVLGAVADELVALGHELLREDLAVGLDLLGVLGPLGGHNLLHLGADGGDLVHVGTALEAGEDGLVDLALEVSGLAVAANLAEEDEAGAGAAEGLVGGGGDNVAGLEGALEDLAGDEASNVGHVHHEEAADGVAELADALVVEVLGVGGGANDDHGGAEHLGGALHLGVVDDAVGIGVVGEGLEEDGGGGDLLLGGVEAVGEVAAAGEVEAHDAGVGLEEAGVDGEVGRGARVGLDVDGPDGGVEAEGGEGALLGDGLDDINVLRTAIVAGTDLTLGVLVGEGGAEAVEDGLRGEVLGGDHLEAAVLAGHLLLDGVVHDGIPVAEGGEAVGHDAVDKRVLKLKKKWGERVASREGFVRAVVNGWLRVGG